MDLFPMDNTPVKGRKMAWLHVDTSPSQIRGSQLSTRLARPLSVISHRLESEREASFLSISEQCRPSSARKWKAPITPRSQTGSFSTDLSEADSWNSWEGLAEAPQAISPGQLSNQTSPNTPLNLNIGDELSIGQPARSWTWLHQNKSMTRGKWDLAPHDEVISTSSIFPPNFQFDLTEETDDMEEEDLSQGTLGAIPSQPFWNVTPGSASGHQMDPYADNENIAIYDGVHDTEQAWRNSSNLHVIGPAYHGLPGIAHSEVTSSWNEPESTAPDNLVNPQDYAHDLRDSSHHSFTYGTNTSFDTLDSAKIESIDDSEMELLAHADSMDSKSSKRKVKKSKPTRRRARSNRAFHRYEARLDGHEIQMCIEPDIPRDDQGKYNADLAAPRRDGYACNQCNKVFKRTEHLSRHLFTHTGRQPFSCAVCGKRFNRKDNCRMHYLTHLHVGKLWKNDYCSLSDMRIKIRRHVNETEAKKDIDYVEKRWKKSRLDRSEL